MQVFVMTELDSVLEDLTTDEYEDMLNRGDVPDTMVHLLIKDTPDRLRRAIRKAGYKKADGLFLVVD